MCRVIREAEHAGMVPFIQWDHWGVFEAYPNLNV